MADGAGISALVNAVKLKQVRRELINDELYCVYRVEK
jgi:hypothetical protein